MATCTHVSPDLHQVLVLHASRDEGMPHNCFFSSVLQATVQRGIASGTTEPGAQQFSPAGCRQGRAVLHSPAQVFATKPQPRVPNGCALGAWRDDLD